MNNKNIEMMKKLIEEKKKKGNSQNRGAMRAQRTIGGGSSKGVKTGNGGGLFVINNIAKDEVDRARWFTLDESKDAILKNSLAEEFLLYILDDLNKG